MHRITTIALGFFLIFFGVQLNVVERYTMTPRTANFLSPDGVVANAVRQPVDRPDNTYESPYYQAGYQSPATSSNRPVAAVSREIRPPRWLCWPVLFFGAVILINGATMHRD
jgi:hypothetical protein